MKGFELSIRNFVYCTVVLLSILQTVTSNFSTQQTDVTSKVTVVNDIFKNSNSSGCPNDCSSHGICSNGQCTCYTFYSGKDCDTRWRENHDWFALWTTYFVIVIIMHVFGMIWSVYNLYHMRHKLSKAHWAKWPMSAYLMMMFFVASLVRVLSYSIDPHAEREIIGTVADAILFNISIILWLSGGCLMFLFWIEIQRASNISALNSVQKLRPVLIGFIIVIVAVIFPAAIIIFITDKDPWVLIYNIFLSVVFILFIIVLTYGGLKLMNVLRQLTRFKLEHSGSSISERDHIFQVFLAKISWFIMYLDAVLVSLILTLIIFEAVDARHHKWRYLIIHTFLRIEEMAVVTCVNMFVMKKKPKGVEGTVASQTASLECHPIDSGTRISLPRSASNISYQSTVNNVT